MGKRKVSMNELIHLVGTGFRTSRVRVSYELKYGGCITGEMYDYSGNDNFLGSTRLTSDSNLLVRELIDKLLRGGPPFIASYDRGNQEVLVKWSLT